ncbi:MAG: redoxin domain-containing protein [Planctomycetes bacterium]|nr:redoxin domain-containing protein [Planctomycetota bacterium]
MLTTLALVFALAQSSPPVDVTLTSADGKAVKLSDYRGKQPVVLLFMRGFTGEFACFFCSKQTLDYASGYEQIRGAGAEVLLILPGAKDVRGYLQAVATNEKVSAPADFTVPFPVLLDTDFSACRAFGVPFDAAAASLAMFPVSEPATIVIGKDGSIVYAFHGKNPSQRPSAEAVLSVLKGSAPKAPSASASPAPAKPTLDWVAYDVGMKSAKEAKKPILLEFFADW